MIIGISGKIGSGKDTVGQIIQQLTLNSYQQSPWQIKKFAYKLKQVCSILTGIPVEDFERQEVKDSLLSEDWNQYGNRYSVRWLLQTVGTECMRNTLHSNVWVNALFADYRDVNPGPTRNLIYPKWIITDVRFPNEANAIKSRGGIVLRVNRFFPVTNDSLVPEHPSETALDDYNFDYVIDNGGSLDELTEKVRCILKEIKVL